VALFYAMAKLPIDDGYFLSMVVRIIFTQWPNHYVAPATGFYGTPGLGRQEVRLAYVLNTNAINHAMDCLEKALEQYPGRTLI
jgi:aspartate aminotransferase